MDLNQETDAEPIQTIEGWDSVSGEENKLGIQEASARWALKPVLSLSGRVIFHSQCWEEQIKPLSFTQEKK